jgi:hypothetical protein
LWLVKSVAEQLAMAVVVVAHVVAERFGLSLSIQLACVCKAQCDGADLHLAGMLHILEWGRSPRRNGEGSPTWQCGIQECCESAAHLAAVPAEFLAGTQHLQLRAQLAQPQALQFLPLPLLPKQAGLEWRCLVSVGHWLRKLAEQALGSAV